MLNSSNKSSVKTNARSRSMSSTTTLPNLNVVTLNTWGIKYVSKDVSLRVKHLITALNENDYDLIALQEVWSQKYYKNIREGVQNKYPYAHYYHSGLIGSGCCLLSKHPIVSTFSYRFSLNGYAHQIHRGDWFGGKLVGLALVDFFGIRINVYVTHLHANYSTDVETDSHAAHRYAQLFELSQFVRLTSPSAPISILMGDLNTFDTENGYKFLMRSTNLLDVCVDDKTSKLKKESTSCCTCHAPTNKYSKSPKFPDGIRIDYILFKANLGFNVECVRCEKCLEKITSIPGDISYSDHDGVFAELKINSINDETSSNRRLMSQASTQSELVDHLVEIKDLLVAKIDSITRFRLFYFLFSFLPLVLLFVFNQENQYLVLFKNVLLTLLVVYFAVYLCLSKTVEKKRLSAVLNDVTVMIEDVSKQK